MTAVLTPEQIEQFNTEGYVTPVQIMDAAEAGTLRAKLEATEAARRQTCARQSVARRIFSLSGLMI